MNVEFQGVSLKILASCFSDKGGAGFARMFNRVSKFFESEDDERDLGASKRDLRSPCAGHSLRALTAPFSPFVAVYVQIAFCAF